MNLILPRGKGDERHPILMPIGQFYSYKHLTGNCASIADLIREIQPIPRVEALRWLCSLSKAILAPPGMKVPVQMDLARQVLPDDWFTSLQRLVLSDGERAGVVFHRRAIWLALQLAVMSCSDSSPQLPNVDIAQRLARTCIMASDILSDIEAEFQGNLSNENITQWMIAALVPTLDSAQARVDFDLIGRSFLLWEDVPNVPDFKSTLQDRKLIGLDEAFYNGIGLHLSEFLRFVTALYARFIANQSQPTLNPLRLDIVNDEIGQVFGDEFVKKATALIAQTPNELSIRLLRSRQSWAFDVTPLRERPLIEVETGQYCCPDLTIFIRACIDRIYFLLQDAYGKDEFRSLFGELFAGYVDLLMAEFAITRGAGRTYFAAPRFQNSNDEAADGILFWTKTAAVMEYKAGLLTTRQRLAGVPEELFRGIESIASKNAGRGRKGVAQLARNFARLLGDESRIISDGEPFELSGCAKLYPILVCYDESLGFHAVTKHLQERFDQELESQNVRSTRIGRLMLLTVRDVELLATSAQRVSVEYTLQEYERHLALQPKDFTGTFSSFVRSEFGKAIDWKQSPTFRKQHDVFDELMHRFGDVGSHLDSIDDDAKPTER